MPTLIVILAVVVVSAGGWWMFSGQHGSRVEMPRAAISTAKADEALIKQNAPEAAILFADRLRRRVWSEDAAIFVDEADIGAVHSFPLNVVWHVQCGERCGWGLHRNRGKTGGGGGIFDSPDAACSD